MLAAGACLCGVNQSGCLVVIWSSRFAVFGPILSTLHNKGPLRPPHESGLLYAAYGRASVLFPASNARGIKRFFLSESTSFELAVSTWRVTTEPFDRSTFALRIVRELRPVRLA